MSQLKLQTFSSAVTEQTTHREGGQETLGHTPDQYSLPFLVGHRQYLCPGSLLRKYLRKEVYLSYPGKDWCADKWERKRPKQSRTEFSWTGSPLRRNKVNRDFVSITAQRNATQRTFLILNSDVCIIPDRLAEAVHRPSISLHCQYSVLQARLVEWRDIKLRNNCTGRSWCA